MASDQDDDDSGNGLSTPASAWTTLIDAPAATEPVPRPMESLRSRLARWRGALGGAARLFRPAEAQSPPLPSAPEAAAMPPEAETAPMDPARVLSDIRAALRRLPPKGNSDLPPNPASLHRLLSDRLPPTDFEAIDLLHDCFPRGTRNSTSRALLAVARNLTRTFGHSGRLPIAGGKAWTMLDSDVFSDELADELTRIGDFILHWQATEKTFLILEFAEIELIEYLFESLDPGRHATLLTRVMEFKVLSSRRAGLLRRVPARVRRRVEAGHGAVSPPLRRYVDDTLAMLDQLAGPGSFAAVANAALTAHAEVERIAAQMTAALPPPSPPPEPPPLHPLMRGLAAPPPAPAPASAAPPEPPTEPTPARPTRRRFTKAQKTEAVLRVLQGEPSEAVAASLGIAAKQLDDWRNAFLDAGNAGLTGQAAPPPPQPPSEPSMDDLKSRLHALIETVEHLSSQIAQIPDSPPEPPPTERKRGRAREKGR
ncbi:transposase [Magnetospirillum sp. SS-4]|uniref:transposase n=1 Tax=Magnetospirillum sp. SS-4 TaxID=2681465 RepID=UPI00157329BF|nr:helix-turn-helix domain-containing protein [Magnetospirillum sp. SS-4]